MFLYLQSFPETITLNIHKLWHQAHIVIKITVDDFGKKVRVLTRDVLCA